MTDTRLHFFLSMYNLKGLGRSYIGKLLRQGFDGDDPVAAIESLALNSIKFIPEIESWEVAQEKADMVIAFCSNTNTHIIPIGSELYPRSFLDINNTPAFLFCRGDASLLNEKKAIAVIGTRKPTELGVKVANRTAAYFSNKGFVIVSGLAAGIDTAAHLGCLDAGGKTVAVLAGIEKISPVANKLLADRIVDNGGLVFSEYPPYHFISKASFVERDFLQATLSLAVFPIEAGENSGTRHAVGMAHKQGKPIFCPDYNRLDYPPQTEQIKGIKTFQSEYGAELFTKEQYEIIVARLNKDTSVPAEELSINNTEV